MTVREAVPADAHALAEIIVAAWDSAYRGLIPDEVIDARTVESREKMFNDIISEKGHHGANEHALACCDECGTVIGLASFAVTPGDKYGGDLIALYIRPDCRRTGCGSLLLKAAAARLKAYGAESMIIWCLEDNRDACGFYSAMGGIPAETTRQDFGGKELTLTGFVWPRI